MEAKGRVKVSHCVNDDGHIDGIMSLYPNCMVQNIVTTDAKLSLDGHVDV